MIEPLRHDGLIHRFTRRRGSVVEVVDLMSVEGATQRYKMRDVVQVPGSRSAANRTVPVQIEDAVVRIPDLASALSLKGAATQTDPADGPAKHLADGITLLACADGGPLDLSNSMRRNINLPSPRKRG